MAAASSQRRPKCFAFVAGMVVTLVVAWMHWEPASASTARAQELWSLGADSLIVDNSTTARYTQNASGIVFQGSYSPTDSFAGRLRVTQDWSSHTNAQIGVVLSTYSSHADVPFSVTFIREDFEIINAYGGFLQGPAAGEKFVALDDLQYAGTGDFTGVAYIQITWPGNAEVNCTFEKIAVGIPTLTPGVTSNSEASGQVSSHFTYEIKADNAPTGFDATGLPPGLTVGKDTGLISGVPTKAGSYPVTLIASNDAGTGTKVLTLRVKPAAPSITSMASATARVNAPFGYDIKASGSPTTFEAIGLPAGLSMDATTGLISGTPATAGNFTVRISAINPDTGSGSAQLALSIAKGTQTISFNPANSQRFRKGRKFTLSATATSRLAVTFKSSNPKILSISGRTATIRGKGKVTVTASQGGTANFLPARTVARVIAVR
jgi:hypothetical protein